MADSSVKKLIIPKADLPPISAEDNSYYVRYRVISQEQLRRSQWSPVNTVPGTVAPEVTKISVAVDNTNKTVTSVWALPSDSDRANQLDISNITSVASKVIVTTTTPHKLRVGEKISISGVTPIVYNLSNQTVVEIPTPTTFSFLSAETAAYLSPGGKVTLPRFTYEADTFFVFVRWSDSSRPGLAYPFRYAAKVSNTTYATVIPELAYLDDETEYEPDTVTIAVQVPTYPRVRSADATLFESAPKTF